MQDQNFEYFLENTEQFYKEYGHKYLAIKDKKIIGVYDTFNEALDKTLPKAPLPEGGLKMNIEKLIQICNYLLKKNNFRLNYTKLIKLLYLADRESLETTNATMTGDTYVSMPSGPVLSQLYDLIRGKYKDKDAQTLWNSRFMVDGYDLVAVTDRIPNGELSRFETNTLDSLYDQFTNADYNGMIQYVHKNCPEWKNPEGSSIPIKMEDILKGIGKNDQEIRWILEEQKAFEEEEAVFASLAAF
jgi:hypothetical protein